MTKETTTTLYTAVRTGVVGRDSIPVRRPDSQSREPGFESHCGRFEPLPSLITPHCHSSLSCINEYLAIQTVVDMWTNSLRAAIAAWLNTSQRSWDGFGMNRSARGWSVKRFEQSYGPDTALYKNIPLSLWPKKRQPPYTQLYALAMTKETTTTLYTAVRTGDDQRNDNHFIHSCAHWPWPKWQ